MESAIQQTYDIVKLLFTRMLPVLFVFTFLQEKGLLNGLDRIAGWVIKWTGFSSVTGQAFLANVGSVYAGSGMLVNLYNEKRISRSYLILSVVYAAFPAHLRIMISSTGPVVFSLLTFPVALFYVGFCLMAALLKLVIAGVLSLFLLSWKETPDITYTTKRNTSTVQSMSTRIAIILSVKRTFYYAWRIALFVSLITLVVFFLEHAGVFRVLPISVTLIGLPEEFNAALFAYMGNAYAGMGIISSLLTHNQADTLSAVKLLVFCMMCSRPIVMIKETPSYYFGLYGPANGAILILFHLSVFLPLCVMTLWIMEIIQ